MGLAPAVFPINLAESEGSSNQPNHASEAPEEEESNLAAPAAPLVVYTEADFWYPE